MLHRKLNELAFNYLSKTYISPQKSKQLIQDNLLNVAFTMKNNPAAKMTFIFF